MIVPLPLRTAQNANNPAQSWEVLGARAIAFSLTNRLEIDAYLTAEEKVVDSMPQPLQTDQDRQIKIDQNCKRKVSRRIT
ncbi:MAG TPA: hypothetical protein V6C57_11890 [Coleofasciculaceae cyanobacterium]